MNYAVKSSFLLSFLESVPAVAAQLKEPNTQDRKFEVVVKSAEQAAVLVLGYGAAGLGGRGSTRAHSFRRVWDGVEPVPPGLKSVRIERFWS